MSDNGLRTFLLLLVDMDWVISVIFIKGKGNLALVCWEVICSGDEKRENWSW